MKECLRCGLFHASEYAVCKDVEQRAQKHLGETGSPPHCYVCQHHHWTADTCLLAQEKRKNAEILKSRAASLLDVWTDTVASAREHDQWKATAETRLDATLDQMAREETKQRRPKPNPPTTGGPA